jgi:aspartyl-tRNA(Asn)/glutamyl-tRNA(Gln) amidotransferase subunit B
MTEYEAVIGLECHVHLDTRSKAFTAAASAFGAPPNTHIDPHTLGLPGSLPVLNRRAVEFALRMGLACGCRIRERSEFARKHYFYPDLPKGYQISQYDAPICEGGEVVFIDNSDSSKRRRVRLVRIHLEEDAGKNVHVPNAPLLSASHLDYNRAGVPLIEIVSEPDLRSAAEAAEFLRAIRQLVRFLQISDGNMEEGSLRCDANVSVRPLGTSTLGTKVEVKNINSFKYVEKAIEYEVARQVEVLRGGGRVVAETRGFDAERGLTRSQRSKEEAHDYRYFPDPDLPPLCLEPAFIESVRAALPELPLARRERYLDALGLPPYDAGVLTAERELGDYFDEMLDACGVPKKAPLTSVERALAKTAANWLASELLGVLNRDGEEVKTVSASAVRAKELAELVRLVVQESISGKQAKEVFARMWKTGESPLHIVQELGLRQESDPSVIEAACRKIILAPANQTQVQKYHQNPKLLGFFIGKVLAETGGRAKPELVSATLVRLLEEGKKPA